MTSGQGIKPVMHKKYFLPHSVVPWLYIRLIPEQLVGCTGNSEAMDAVPNMYNRVEKLDLTHLVNLSSFIKSDSDNGWQECDSVMSLLIHVRS